jgi:hypothetical protein
MLGVAMAFAVYAAASVATAAHLQTTWDSVAARHWETNVERGFHSLSARPGALVIADQEVPFDVVSSSFAPLNQLSYVLPIYAPGFRVDGPLTGPLMTVTTNGDVVRATIATATPTTLDRSRLRGDHVRVSGPLGRSADRTCVSASPTPLRLRLTPNPGATTSGPFFLVLNYSTAQPTELPLMIDTKSGETTESVVVAPYAHSSIAWLATDPVRRLEIVLAPHTALCLRSSAIVTLRTS